MEAAQVLICWMICDEFLRIEDISKTTWTVRIWIFVGPLMFCNLNNLKPQRYNLVKVFLPVRRRKSGLLQKMVLEKWNVLINKKRTKSHNSSSLKKRLISSDLSIPFLNWDEILIIPSLTGLRGRAIP